MVALLPQVLPAELAFKTTAKAAVEKGEGDAWV